jgi:hypothetical protein
MYFGLAGMKCWGFDVIQFIFVFISAGAKLQMHNDVL